MLDKETINALSNLAGDMGGDKATETVEKILDYLDKSGFKIVKDNPISEVFIASFSDEDGTEIMGVYSTQDKGDEAIKVSKRDRLNFYSTPYVNCYSLDVMPSKEDPEDYEDSKW